MGIAACPAGDQSFLREPHQRLAHGALRAIETVGQFQLAQRRARLKRAKDDRLAQGRLDHLAATLLGNCPDCLLAGHHHHAHPIQRLHYQ